LAVFGAPLAALAAEESGTKLILPAANEIIWGTVAFLLLLLVLARAGVFKSISKALAERTARIQGEMERAAQERAEADDLLAQYRRQLADARAESNRIMEEAKASAEQMRRELLAKAEADANRVVARAQEEIQAERNRVLSDLRGETASLALGLAGRVIGETLDDERHRRLVDRYIEELTPRGEG
jgi:F-type H+-transporting ATPase subunit b